MSFKSEAQRRFMWANHPKIARRWAHEYPQKGKKLPMYTGFNKLKGQLAGRPGVTNAGALAAAIGRKKYGKNVFQEAAAKGQKLRGRKTRRHHAMERYSKGR